MSIKGIRRFGPRSAVALASVFIVVGCSTPAPQQGSVSSVPSSTAAQNQPSPPSTVTSSGTSSATQTSVHSDSRSSSTSTLRPSSSTSTRRPSPTATQSTVRVTPSSRTTPATSRPAAGCQTYPGPVGDLVIDPCARRDANGFAVDGPALPDAPSEQSSAAECRAYRDQLRAWSNYQNAHRPPGATAGLPMSSQVQNLYLVCNLGYYDS